MAKRLTPWCKAVKIAMIERDITNQELAERIGKDKRYVSAVVNGRVVSEPVIKLISDELNIVDDYDSAIN